jgi:predicted tellurium resistance membrane protein TerC
MLLLKSISEFIDIKKHKYFKIIRYYKNFKDVIQQIFIINFVLAIDSTATAVGLTNYATIAILSILVTIIIMCFATKKLSALIYANLSIKLVTSFVILIISLLMILKGLLIKCDVNMFYIAFLLAMIIEIVKITYLKEEGK